MHSCERSCRKMSWTLIPMNVLDRPDRVVFSLIDDSEIFYQLSIFCYVCWHLFLKNFVYVVPHIKCIKQIFNILLELFYISLSSLIVMYDPSCFLLIKHLWRHHFSPIKTLNLCLSFIIILCNIIIHYYYYYKCFNVNLSKLKKILQITVNY